MIPVPPDVRTRRASARTAFALAIALSALAAACGREPQAPNPPDPAAAAAESPPAEPTVAPASTAAAEPVNPAAPEPPFGLVVGCRAPDFESRDTEGTRFKLSDYRGKVVVLDFWGFW